MRLRKGCDFLALAWQALVLIALTKATQYRSRPRKAHPDKPTEPGPNHGAFGRYAMTATDLVRD